MAVTSFPLLVIPCKVCRESLFKKGTPASAANRHRGWHGAVNAPMHSCLAGIPFRPRPTANGPGSLLSGVRRRQQDQGHSYKQDENDPHGYCPPYPLAPCRAHGGRATVQERYTAIPYSLQSLSLRISNEAATLNEPEHGFFHFFSSVDSHRMERGSKGRQPIASRRVVRGAYIHGVCWPSEIGDGFRYASDTLSGEEDSSPIFLTGSLVQHYSVNQ